MATKKKPPASETPTLAGWEVGAGTSLDVEALRQIVDILEASDISRLSWRRGREQLIVRRGAIHIPAAAPLPATPAVAVAPVPTNVVPIAQAASASKAAVAPAPETKPGHQVTSPFVGTFYRNPAPDQPAFVEVGTVIKKGQVLCIIEAMKLMNEIEADVGGKVVEVMAESGQPVEYGQALFRIEPT